MLDQATTSDGDWPETQALVRRGVAVHLILSGTLSLSSGFTALGLVNLVTGMVIGATELLRGLRRINKNPSVVFLGFLG
jgi:hypothetical protein